MLKGLTTGLVSGGRTCIWRYEQPSLVFSRPFCSGRLMSPSERGAVYVGRRRTKTVHNAIIDVRNTKGSLETSNCSFQKKEI